MTVKGSLRTVVVSYILLGENILLNKHVVTDKVQSNREIYAFTANGKRQAEISRSPKTREIYLVSAYILPVSHSYGVSTKNREIS